MMKPTGFVLLMVAALGGCRDKEPSPSLAGKFVGPVSVENSTGLRSYSQEEITLTPMGPTSVEVSGRPFESFVIDGINQAGQTYLAETGGNMFRYSAGTTAKTLLIDWKTTINGTVQTLRFGGEKKGK